MSALVQKFIAENQPLLEYLIQKLNLKPLNEICWEGSGIDCPTLFSQSGSFGIEFSDFLGDGTVIDLCIPDDCSWGVLREHRGYQEDFEGVHPRRLFMNDPICDTNYRLLLGLELALEMVFELRQKKIGAVFDIRISVYGRDEDYGGYRIMPIEGEAKLANQLLMAYSCILDRRYSVKAYEK